MIPEGVYTFSDLVKWLVKDRHKGNYYGMAVKLKVSSGLPYLWRDATVRAPHDPMIERVCAAYGLDFWEVKDLISGRLAAMAKPPLATAAGRRSGRGSHPPLGLSSSAPRRKAPTSASASARTRALRKHGRTPKGDIMSTYDRLLPWAA